METNTPPLSKLPVQSQKPIEPDKSWLTKNALLVCAVLSVILAAGAVLYFTATNQTPNREGAQESQNSLDITAEELAQKDEVTAPESENENLTKNWTTYTNSKFGFEVKHPTQFEYPKVQFYDYSSKPGNHGDAIEAKPIWGWTVDVYPECRLCGSVTAVGLGKRSSEEIANLLATSSRVKILDDTTKDGIRTIVYDENPKSTEQKPNCRNAVKLGVASPVKIYLQNGSNGKCSEYYDYYINVMSTFKFSGANQTSDEETIVWKTYTNNELGFKFQYPENLEVTSEYQYIYVTDTKTSLRYTLSVNENAFELTPIQYVQGAIADYGVEVGSLKEILINGLQAAEINLSSGTVSNRSVYFATKDNIINIQYHLDDGYFTSKNAQAQKQDYLSNGAKLVESFKAL